MKLWHSSDWHLSFLDDGTIQKPMDQRSWSSGTRHYTNYLARLEAFATANISRDDVVCITGDITHEVGNAKLLPNLMWIYDAIPAHIVLIRGNHDQRLSRDKTKALIQSSSLWHRMHFLWEDEFTTVQGLNFYCISDHHNARPSVRPGDSAWLDKVGNADVLLSHYPVTAYADEVAILSRTRARAFLSGHIHCTSNKVEGGIDPKWYDSDAEPTDNKTVKTATGHMFYSTGTTDVLDWKTGQLFKEITLTT